MERSYWRRSYGVRFHRLCAFVVVGGLLMISRAGLAHPGHVEPIAKARQEPLGATVTVRGTVTVPSGAFDGGFALQQDEAGIYVLDSLAQTYAAGTELTVTGILTDSFGLLGIQPSSIRSAGRGHRIEPACERTGAVGEETEGQLLRLRGTMRGPLVDDSPYGFKLDIDDGSGPVQVFLYPGAGISIAGLADGAEISVVCFSNQFEDVYECDPRSPADLRIGERR
jgi:hypothetical protein